MSKIHQKKSLGQVFLIRDEPSLRCVDLLKELGITDVIEIGPGSGALTEKLLQASFSVTAIEKDARFAALLSSRYTADQLTIVQADFLEIDLNHAIETTLKRTKSDKKNAKIGVVGNIPYYISSPIVQKIMDQIQSMEVAILLTQKEFAERCLAPAGGKDFGSLTVYCQLRANCQALLDVPRTWFEPIPKVDSVLWSMKPHSAENRISDTELLAVEKITKHAFHQRRKKISNGLKPFLSSLSPERLQDIQTSVGISFDMRPEQLTPRQFYVLTKELRGI